MGHGVGYRPGVGYHVGGYRGGYYGRPFYGPRFGFGIYHRGYYGAYYGSPYVWIPGFWNWGGSDYLWVAGAWATPPTVGATRVGVNVADQVGQPGMTDRSLGCGASAPLLVAR